MKAHNTAAYGCCKCGYLMAVNGNPYRGGVPWKEVSYMACCNSKCEEYEVKYKVPVFELEKYEEK